MNIFHNADTSMKLEAGAGEARPVVSHTPATFDVGETLSRSRATDHHEK